MKQVLYLLMLLVLSTCGNNSSTSSPETKEAPIKLQLNWFHDPTFTGEYKAKELLGVGLVISEGGVNVSPVQRLKSGLADVAVVGIDIVLKAIEVDLELDGQSSIRIVYVDFQRNPVGWILHPRTASKFGMPNLSGSSRNDWLFNQFRNGNIRPGDKRGTETTAVWTRWREIHKLQGINVTAVGFDPTIMLDAPDLAYPVYLNEEPYKLAERIGKEMVIFDPIDDNVELYGNVLITRDDVLKSRPEDIKKFLVTLTESWKLVKRNPNQAVNIVRPLYPEVSDDVLRSQIVRTTEFVFYNTEHIGGIDISSGGRLDKTISALKSAGSLKKKTSIEQIAPYVAPFGGSRQ